MEKCMTLLQRHWHLNQTGFNFPSYLPIPCTILQLNKASSLMLNVACYNEVETLIIWTCFAFDDNFVTFAIPSTYAAMYTSACITCMRTFVMQTTVRQQFNLYIRNTCLISIARGIPPPSHLLIYTTCDYKIQRLYEHWIVNTYRKRIISELIWISYKYLIYFIDTENIEEHLLLLQVFTAWKFSDNFS